MIALQINGKIFVRETIVKKEKIEEIDHYMELGHARELRDQLSYAIKVVEELRGRPF